MKSSDVPPTLVSFAVTTAKAGDILSNHFKTPGSRVWLLSPEYGDDGLPVTESLISVFDRVRGLNESGAVLSAYTPDTAGSPRRS